jgi:hypothetical protein
VVVIIETAWKAESRRARQKLSTSPLRSRSKAMTRLAPARIWM